jgi:hypothetical protein
LIKDRSVAVVGNSGCELHKGRGAEIDAHDVVFRFNEFSLEHADDYGSKLTAWVTAGNGNPTSCTYPVGLVYCPLWHTHASFNREFPPSDWMDREPFDELYKATAAPSTGIAFLWWLATLKPLRECGIYGFSFFDPHVEHHYWEAVRWPLTHDRARELEIFRDLYAHPELELRCDARALLRAVQGGVA